MQESWPAMHHTDVAADQFYVLRAIHFGAYLKPCSASCLPFLFEILLPVLTLYTTLVRRIRYAKPICPVQFPSTRIKELRVGKVFVTLVQVHVPKKLSGKWTGLNKETTSYEL